MLFKVTLLSALLLFLRLALPLPASRAQQGGDPVCPLSEDQTQKAIAAFAELAPIFQQPRCINCHGAVDPFNKPGTHPGGDLDPKDNTDCSTCHDALEGWELAPEPMSFVGKDTEELCEQMKFMFKFAQPHGTDESFMGHMVHDNGAIQFIETGFKGNKGMSEPEKLEPPVGWTQQKMIDLSKKWVDAMGGRFHGDASCGCKKQAYSLKLDYKSVLNVNLGLISGEYTMNTQNAGGTVSSNGIDIPLEITQPGTLKGEGVMVFGGGGQFATVVGPCSGQSQHSMLVRASGSIEEGDEESRGKDNKLHLKLKCDQMHFTSSGACPRGSGSVDNFQACAEDLTVDFVPADTDVSKAQIYPLPLPNSQATITTTIVPKQ